MKNFKTLLITTAVALTFNANAHDPSMHAKKAAKLDCSGYEKMVASGTKMDMSDPVMLAMMKKCKNKTAEHDNADGHHDTEKAGGKCGDMSDGHHDADAKTGDSKCGNMNDGHHDKKEMKCGDMSDGHHDKKSDKKCGDMKASGDDKKGEMKCGNMDSSTKGSDSKCGN